MPSASSKNAASPHGSLQDARPHPVAGPAARSGRMLGAPAHQVSARVPSYLPLNSSSGAMYCSSRQRDTSARCATLMHTVIRLKHNYNPRHAACGMSSAGVPHLRGAARGLAGGLPQGVFGEAEVRHLQLRPVVQQQVVQLRRQRDQLMNTA